MGNRQQKWARKRGGPGCAMAKEMSENLCLLLPSHNFERSERTADEEIGSTGASTLLGKRQQPLPDRQTPAQTQWGCVCHTHAPSTRSQRQRLPLRPLASKPSLQAGCLLTLMGTVSDCVPGHHNAHVRIWSETRIDAETAKGQECRFRPELGGVSQEDPGKLSLCAFS